LVDLSIERIERKRDRWRAWRPTASMFFLNGAMFGMWATQIPVFRERLDLSPFALSLVLLTLSAGTALSMALSAFIIRVIGVTTSIRASAALYCVFGSLVPLSPSAPALAVVVLVFGAAGGCMNVAINTYATNVQKQLGRSYMSSFHGMWSLGGFAGSGGGALLMRGLSPAAEAAVASVLMLLLLSLEQHGLLPFQGHKVADQLRSRTRTSITGPTILLGVMAAFAFSGEGVVLDWAAVYMTQSLGAGAQLALVGYIAFAASMASMRFVGDHIRRRTSARNLIAMSGIVAAFGLLLGPLSRNPIIMDVGCAIAGAGIANIVPTLFSLAGDLPRSEVQIAAVSTMGFAGLLAAPPLFGMIGQHYGLGIIFLGGAAGDALIACLAIAGIKALFTARLPASS
jgi:predicted MFS family arabinose efflux permease